MTNRTWTPDDLVKADPSVEWREVPGYPNYIISSEGVIYSKKKKGILKVHTRHKGYVSALLIHEKVRVVRNVSRWVLISFIREPKEREEAAHLDGDVTNNRLANLAWCSPSENNFHKNLHGTMVRGEKMHNAKLSDAQVAEVRALFRSGRTQASLAAQFNVSYVSIHEIVRGKKRCYPANAGVLDVKGNKGVSHEHR